VSETIKDINYNIINFDEKEFYMEVKIADDATVWIEPAPCDNKDICKSRFFRADKVILGTKRKDISYLCNELFNSLGYSTDEIKNKK
jgi:hypothetical protein